MTDTQHQQAPKSSTLRGGDLHFCQQAVLPDLPAGRPVWLSQGSPTSFGRDMPLQHDTPENTCSTEVQCGVLRFEKQGFLGQPFHHSLGVILCFLVDKSWSV